MVRFSVEWVERGKFENDTAARERTECGSLSRVRTVSSSSYVVGKMCQTMSDLFDFRTVLFHLVGGKTSSWTLASVYVLFKDAATLVTETRSGSSPGMIRSKNLDGNARLSTISTQRNSGGVDCPCTVVRKKQRDSPKAKELKCFMHHRAEDTVSPVVASEWLLHEGNPLLITLSVLPIHLDNHSGSTQVHEDRAIAVPQ